MSAAQLFSFAGAKLYEERIAFHFNRAQNREKKQQRRKPDNGDRRSDHDGGHDFIDPLYAREFYGDCDDHVHQACKRRADQQTQHAERHTHAARERRAHRTEKRERAAEKHGAFEFGEQQIDDCTDARAEQRRGGRKPVLNDHGNGDRRRQNRKQLLQRKQDQPRNGRSVFYVINHFHSFILSFV